METTNKVQNDYKSPITKKDVQKSFWRWTFFSHSNYNYERLQATGVVYALSPVLKKLYGDNDEEMTEALIRHMQFFNTEPHFGGPILSTTIAMEEAKANPNTPEIPGDAISGFKTGLMGPLAGVGDTLWQGTLIPILLSITIPFGNQGNILMGPVLFFFSHLLIMVFTAYNLWMKGYETGREGILSVMESGIINKLLSFARTLGAIVMGALGAQFVVVSTPVEIPIGDGMMSIQADVFDQLFEGFIPLIIILVTYYLLKKQYKPTTVIVILIAIAVVFGGLGWLA